MKLLTIPQRVDIDQKKRYIKKGRLFQKKTAVLAGTASGGGCISVRQRKKSLAAAYGICGLRDFFLCPDLRMLQEVQRMGRNVLEQLYSRSAQSCPAGVPVSPCVFAFSSSRGIKHLHFIMK